MKSKLLLLVLKENAIRRANKCNKDCTALQIGRIAYAISHASPFVGDENVGPNKRKCHKMA